MFSLRLTSEIFKRGRNRRKPQRFGVLFLFRRAVNCGGYLFIIHVAGQHAQKSSKEISTGCEEVSGHRAHRQRPGFRKGR